MFTPSTHTLVGASAAYIPVGSAPYDVTAAYQDSGMVLINGDTVDVISAWTRDYLPATAPTLLYVRSRTTGKSTHVTENDLHSFSF